MFQNFFKITFRNIIRHKYYSLINIVSMSIGTAVFIILLLYLIDEARYDRYHQHSDDIFRVVNVYDKGGLNSEIASSPFLLATKLKEDYPNLVKETVRFFNSQDPVHLVEYEDKRFNEKYFFYVDASVLDVFDFQLIMGNRKTALTKANSVIITEAIAKKYFGDVPPMGKKLILEEGIPLEVTGVLADIPTQSHFKFDFLASFRTLDLFFGRVNQTWIWSPCWTYIQLNEGIDKEQLEKEFPRFVQAHFDDAEKENISLYLQALTDIHLRSHIDYEIERNNNVLYLYVLFGIAIIILIIASINFMNLTTVNSANRAKEIAIRKVHGVNYWQLVVQFLGESVILSFIALFFSLFLVEAILPYFNQFTEKNIQITVIFSSYFFIILIFVGFMTGIMSGLYPSLFLSSLPVAKIMKGSWRQGTRGKRARQALVLVQFTFSIIILIVAFVTFLQFSYLQNAYLGFDKEKTVILTVNNTSIVKYYSEFKDELLKNPYIEYITGMNNLIGTEHDTQKFTPEGFPENKIQFYPQMYVRYDFIECFDINLLAGRDFTKQNPANLVDATDEIMINRAMSEHLGCKTPSDAIGKYFRSFRGNEKIIGVINDFNTSSLHKHVDPLVISMVDVRRAQWQTRFMAIKFKSNRKKGLKFLKKKWIEFSPNRPFEYAMLDEILNKQYRNEEILGTLSIFLTLFIIFITNIGVWGLTLVLTEKRTKEIGIRKVLGAPVGNIVRILSIEFVKLNLIANAIAWPIAFLMVEMWLQNFAYRIDVELWIFFVSMLVVLVSTLMIISIQAIRVARKNPISSLRYE